MTNNQLENTVHKGTLYVLILIISFFAVPVVFPATLLPVNLQSMVIFILSHLTAMAVYYIITKPADFKGLIALNPTTVNHCLFGLSLGICMQPALMIVSGLSSFIFPNKMSTALMDYSSMPFYITIITIAVVPGIMEEIGFRGIALSNFSKMTTKKAALASGFLFALVHLDLQQFLYTFIIGVIFAYVARSSKSIIPTILAHITINATQVFISYSMFTQGVLPKVAQRIGILLGNFFGSPLGLIGSFAYVIGVVSFIRKENQKDLGKSQEPKIFDFKEAEDIRLSKEDDKTFEKDDKFLNPSLICILVIYILVAVLL